MVGERTFLNDNAVLLDAQKYLAHLQMDASTRSGASPLLRADEARRMMREHSDEMDLGTRLVGHLLIAKNPVLDLATSHAAGLIQFVKPFLRPVLRRVPVGTLATPDFTIKTTHAPAGGPVVIVPIGFLGAIHDIAERTAAALPYGGCPEVSRADAAAYIRRRILYRPGQRWDEPPFRIRNFVKSVLTGGLGNDAVHFALAHEYAHVLGDLVGGAAAGAEAEYVADLVGSNLAVAAAAHPLNFQSSRRYGLAGAALVLHTTRVAEELGVVAVQRSHPPAIHPWPNRRFTNRSRRCSISQ